MAIITFKRFFEITPYILILPKIFINNVKKIKILNCLNYYFKHSYSFLVKYNFSNLIFVPFLTIFSFLNFLKTYIKNFFNLKFKNLYFNFSSFNTFNFLSIISLKKFILKLKQIFFLRSIYNFTRYFTN